MGTYCHFPAEDKLVNYRHELEMGLKDWVGS